MTCSLSLDITSFRKPALISQMWVRLFSSEPLPCVLNRGVFTLTDNCLFLVSYYTIHSIWPKLNLLYHCVPRPGTAPYTSWLLNVCTVHDSIVEKAESLASCKNQVQILTLMLKTCATSGMLLALSEPHSYPLSTGWSGRPWRKWCLATLRAQQRSVP